MKKNNDLIYGNKNRYWTELKFNVKRMNGWVNVKILDCPVDE